MPQAPRIHNLRENRSERTPARWLFLDTETLPQLDAAGELHQLRLWCAHLVERRGPSRKRDRVHWFYGGNAGELADAVTDACRASETLWVCAHNLGFDLVVTGLPLVLVDRGWTITQHALTGSAPWLRLRRGGSSITMVDSHSWLPVPEQQLGDDLGIDKLPLPAWSDSDRVWFDRCEGDVRILEAAMLQLLEWWDDSELGHWSLSGPGSGFNTYRHRGFRSPVVIDPDPDARAFERRTIYGGRAEVWRVGRLPLGRYATIDFEHAFGSVCAELSLPRRRGVAFDSLPLDHRALGDSRLLTCIADVELETDTPRYPLRTRGGIVHPVGRFCTTLAGPEIAEARRRGELRAVGRGWFYGLAPHMQDWARWALAIVEDVTDVPPMARIAVKAWTRTVPGRWAGRTSRVELTLDGAPPGWRLERGCHHPGGAKSTTLDMGGRRYWMVHDVDMDNAFPAVLAFIQSHVRVALGRLVDLLGAGAVVTCNTDGLLVDLDAVISRHGCGRRRALTEAQQVDRLNACLATWAAQLAPLFPVCKGINRDVDVISPQHLVVDGDRQLAGVPRSAQPLGDHRYSFVDWPSMGAQLQLGDQAGYVRQLRTVDLSSVPVLRWVLADGSTLPVAAAGRLQEPSQLLPWVRTPGAATARLAGRQHPILMPLTPPLTLPEAV